MAWSNRLKNDNSPRHFSQSTWVAGLCPHRPAEETLFALRFCVGSPLQRTQPSLFTMSWGRECGVSDKTPCCFLVRHAVYHHKIQICSICKGWRDEEVVNSLEVCFLLSFWNVQFQTWNSMRVWFTQECSHSQKCDLFPSWNNFEELCIRKNFCFLTAFLFLLSHIQFFHCFMCFVVVKQF